MINQAEKRTGFPTRIKAQLLKILDRCEVDFGRGQSDEGHRGAEPIPSQLDDAKPLFGISSLSFTNTNGYGLNNYQMNTGP